jgi:hypothetical protein
MRMMVYITTKRGAAGPAGRDPHNRDR